LTDKKMSDAETGLKRLYGTLEHLDDALQESSGRGIPETEREIEHAVQKHKDAFIDAMDEDFNTPKALAVLFDLSREVNKLVEKKKQVSSMLFKNIYDLFLELGNVFGLFQKRERKKHDENLVNNLISLLVELRNNLRRKGDFGLSDEIRAQLKKMGVRVEDASEGSTWKLA
jgi:cysteinyl-tRNA synthetase